jgi:2-oxoglutarate dehydrogenase E2 component (dihydrolipoamide succinyltransferase)
MSTEIKVPVLPESVTDAVIAKWHKNVGEMIKKDEPLVDIETDKVVLEVTSPVQGVIDSLLFQVGSLVKGQQVIGVIKEIIGDQTTPSVAVAVAPSMPVNPNNSERQQDESVKRKEPALALKETEPLFSPAIRKMLHEHDIKGQDVIDYTGNKKITVEDIQHYLSQKQNTQVPIETQYQDLGHQPLYSVEQESTPIIQHNRIKITERVEHREPMSRLRLKIAERLVQAQHTAAILTTFNEIDMQPIMNLRVRYKEEFEKKHQIKLGFMSFFIKASQCALERFPIVNASIDKDDIIYHDYYDIGVAVASERGLVVPIIRNVEQHSLPQLEQAVANLSHKARCSLLSMDDLTGGTFTITNGGVFGSLLSTPIINPPQTAILGMHKIEQRPVVVDNQIVIRPMMYVALSYDHRLIDGADAVQFLVTIKTLLQEPERLLLDL